MLVYYTGDLLKSNEKLLVHGCNASNGFGSGFAFQVAKLYPEVKKSYHDWYEKNNGLKLGEWKAVKTHDGKTVINLVTQQSYGKPEEGPYVSYPAIRDGVTSILDSYSGIISMPCIGAGLAGGNWEIIESILEKVSKDREIRIYVL